MADLIDRDALLKSLEYNPLKRSIVQPKSTFGIILSAPTVDAVDEKALNIVLKQEFTRLYFDDEKMREHMAGYNPSSFLAGYLYALDCVMGDITLLSRERRTNATDRR